MKIGGLLGQLPLKFDEGHEVLDQGLKWPYEMFTFVERPNPALKKKEIGKNPWGSSIFNLTPGAQTGTYKFFA